MKILVAEDDTVSAMVRRRTLERLEHEVTVAGDGEDAWDRVRGDVFEVVISDWTMPKLDGLCLFQRIRERPAAPYSYLILLTARAEHGDRLEGLLGGADDFLSKPLGMGELFARLEIAERILGLQKALSQATRANEHLQALCERQAQELASARARLSTLAPELDLRDLAA